ncbi:MAG: hypothetical protein F6K30_19040 [Cyanothece sp. SIO2G6]|nr:hypothetical protein [Cyanothece sp. SIO2G6]
MTEYTSIFGTVEQSLGDPLGLSGAEPLGSLIPDLSSGTGTSGVTLPVNRGSLSTGEDNDSFAQWLQEQAEEQERSLPQISANDPITGIQPTVAVEQDRSDIRPLSQLTQASENTITNFSAASLPVTSAQTPPVRIEAESFEFENYRVRWGDFASGDRYIQVSAWPGRPATASFTVDQPAGRYDIVVGYYDEADGNATYSLTLNDNEYQWIADVDTGTPRPDADSLIQRTVVSGAELTPGQTIELTATRIGRDVPSFDFVELIPSAATITTPGEGIAPIIGEAVTPEGEYWTGYQSLTDHVAHKGDLTNLITGDFNGDGRDDFIRQEKGSWDNDDYRTAEIFLALGDGTFSQQLMTDFTRMKGDETRFVVGDFNGDGADDFILQQYANFEGDDGQFPAQLYFSNRDGTFDAVEPPPSWWIMQGHLATLEVGDFNGDGRDDLIRREQGRWADLESIMATTYLSNGDGSFSEVGLPEDWGLRSDFTNLHIGDFNGDGVDDFIGQSFGGEADDAKVYLGRGDGSFEQIARDPNWWVMDGDLTNLMVGDFNGDGWDDFIRQEKGYWDTDEINRANVYLSQGDGTFRWQYLTDMLDMKGDLTTLIVGDYNGDGADDFIRQEKGVWDDDRFRTAEIYLSNRNGTFTREDIPRSFAMKGDLTNLIVGDYDGDGRTDFIRQEKGAWDDNDRNTAEVFLSHVLDGQQEPLRNPDTDIDGDGRADAIVVNDGAVTVRRSTGNSFGAYEIGTDNTYWGERGTFFADVNGDGRGDAIVVNNNGITVRRSTGSSFGAYETWTDNTYWGERGTFFADVDGDNQADAIVVNNNGITVRRSTGSSFGAYETWTDNTYWGERGTFFADVDGDNQADAIVVNNNGITVRRSTGSSFGAYETWTDNAYWGERGTFFADVDGDTRADAIVVNNNGITVRRSTGSGFGAYETWTDNTYWGERGTSFTDVDGDGRADAVVVNDGGITVRRSTDGKFGAYETWTDNTYWGERGTFVGDSGHPLELASGQLRTPDTDVDGDGRADAIVVNQNAITIRRSTGSSFGAYETGTNNTYYGEKGTFFADVDGDNQADAIVVNEDKVTVRRSTGNGFGGYESWTDNTYYGQLGTFFADVDGDDRADAIVVNEDKITVRRSTGNGFGGYESWTDNTYYGQLGTFFADVDGDDRVDAIVVNEDRITVRRSTGNGFGGYESWTDNTYYGQLGTFFADVDGDDRADAIVVNEDRITVRRSTGNGFGGYESWTDNTYYGEKGTFFADVDGNNRADAIVVNEDKITVRRSTGNGFGNYESWTGNAYYGERGTYIGHIGYFEKEKDDDNSLPNPGYTYRDIDYLNALYQDNTNNYMGDNDHNHDHLIREAVDSYDLDTIKDVHALVGGEVIEARNGVDIRATFGRNPVFNDWKKNGTVAIYNQELNKTFIYWHFAEGSINEGLKGQTITEGSRIGLEGNTGYSFGAHTHVEIHNGRANINMAYGSSPNPDGRQNVETVFQDAVRRGLVKLFK